jgi:RHS repeat-associated protein
MRKDGKITDAIQAVRYTSAPPSGSSSSSSASSSSSGCPATAPVTTAGALSPFDSFPQCSYTRWTTTQYTDCCLVASQRVYKLIPSSGIGASGTNYDETDFGYDVMKRRNRNVSPGGTITRTVFDAPGRPIGSWVGTDDTGATASNPAGSGSPNNMVIVTGTVYDFGKSGGDSNPTQQTQYVDATGANDRVTNFLFDFRNRQTDTDGEIDLYAKQYFDNLDRICKKERYDTSFAGNLIARRTTCWDDRSTVFKTAVFAVDPSTGIVGNALVSNAWQDASQNVVKSLRAGSQLFEKTTFDSLGRPSVEYIGYGTDVTYADVFTTANNTILEQTEMIYDAGSNAIQSQSRQRYHNAAAVQLGNLGDPSTIPNARVAYVAIYPDALGRIAAVANYGTNGGASLLRSSTIPPSRDTCLVDSAAYNARGEDYLAIDPAGTAAYRTFDDRGRKLTLVENYIATSSSSSSSSGNMCNPSDDTNRETGFTYSPDGAMATVTAVNSATGNQTTQNIFGATLTDSAVASSLLRRYQILPDSISGSDQKAFTYNRQGEITTFADQNGTVHSYDRDLLGRQTADRITTLGSGVDGAVLRISKTFDVRSLVQNLTSYDNATVGFGSVVNDVQLSYNGYWQLLADYQSHSGAVDVSTTPNVQYAYADGSENTIRATSLTYPNGRVLNYDYGTPDGISDSASRIESLIDDDGVTHLADYSYLGANSIVQVNEMQPGIQYTLVGIQGGNDPVTGDIYRGLDLFSRVKDLIWVSLGGSSSSSSSSGSSCVGGTNIVRIQHGYDRASNRLWRKDLVAVTSGAAFDELYRYDGLYRLSTMQRGAINSTQTAITAGVATFGQCWTLDATGNWEGFREDDTGSGTWDLIQTRTANTVNEISDISDLVGPSWVIPVYDASGNMTKVPQPASPSSAYAVTYDAWNRAVKLTDPSTGNTVETNAYDGRKYRTNRSDYTAGVLSETRDLFYTALWQSIEEWIGTSTNPDRQFVWGVRFIDDLVLRDRASTGGVGLNERFYALQDALGSVAAIVNSLGVVGERYAYMPYGDPIFLSPEFVPESEAVFNWETLFAGYRADLPSALYVVRGRLLCYATGTWLMRDPIEYVDSLNLYAYVMGRAVTFVDPTGLESLLPPIVRGPGYRCAACHPVQPGPSRPDKPLPNWGAGRGTFHKTTHKITFQVSNQQSCERLQKQIYNDLKSFKFFNGGANNVATVSMNRSDNTAEFDALGFMGLGSDFINADKSPVSLEFNDATSCVTATTLTGHMLEGQRTWMVLATRGMYSDCNVDIITIAFERKVGFLNDWAAWFVGTDAQLEIWDQYLLNLRNAYGSSPYDLWHFDNDTGSTAIPGRGK